MNFNPLIIVFSSDWVRPDPSPGFKILNTEEEIYAKIATKFEYMYFKINLINPKKNVSSSLAL
ncbi:hypothetical protein BpHYR1_012509 [Brachionus plicatilis]|uniref:Uncharacterized protein n=1 Tax=Brachionus plicatilis TaxID=10195 RepID=A0A3M7QK40_BRAPC|nr:hypothetical protein BpHYR1_012509 [Brachionus plicatilis]